MVVLLSEVFFSSLCLCEIVSVPLLFPLVEIGNFFCFPEGGNIARLWSALGPPTSASFLAQLLVYWNLFSWVYSQACTKSSQQSRERCGFSAPVLAVPVDPVGRSLEEVLLEAREWTFC